MNPKTEPYHPKHPTLKRYFVGGVLLFLLCFGLYVLTDQMMFKSDHLSRPLVSNHPMVGQSAPYIPDEWSNKQKPLVVHFFATWCAPCRQEWPQLMQLKQQGWDIVGIVYHDQTKTVQQWLAENGDPFVQWVNDHDGHWAVSWGVRGVPETFIIGPQHDIVHHTTHLPSLLTTPLIQGIRP